MIHFVTVNRDTFLNPTLVQVMSDLVQRGAGVTLRSGPLQVAVPTALLGVPVVPIPPRFERFPVRPGAILRLVSSYRAAVHGINAGDVLIGIDPGGLRLARQFQRLRPRTRLGYFSFEILFGEDIGDDAEAAAIRRAEPAAARHVEFCLIQDETRQDALQTEVRFPASCRWFRVPVAPAAPKPVNPRSCPRPGVPLRVIHSGSLAEWSAVPDVLEAIPTCQADVEWEFHSPRGERALDQRLYCRWIRSLGTMGKPVQLHLASFEEWGAYIDYLMQFDVGLALYRPNRDHWKAGRNSATMGLSSGKFASYMMAGMPAITLDHGLFGRLNDEFGFGYVMRSMADLEPALAHIRANYASCSSGAVRLYRERLCPTDGVRQVCDYLCGAV